MAKSGQERRKHLRVATPLEIRVIGKDNKVYETITKDISPIGLRFEIKAEGVEVKDEVEIKIEMPKNMSPVHVKAKIVWKKKATTEDGAPCEIGCEFSRVEEDNKNTFLKFFCDLLYAQAKTISEKGA